MQCMPNDNNNNNNGSSFANKAPRHPISISNDWYDARLQQFLKENGARPYHQGIIIARLCQRICLLPSTPDKEKILSYLVRLNPPANFISKQKAQEKEVLSYNDNCFSLLLPVIRDLKKIHSFYANNNNYDLIAKDIAALIKIFSDYITAIINSSIEERASLLNWEAVIYSDRSNVPYLIAEDLARELLCIDEFGFSVKKNDRGNHAVAQKGDLFFKPNPEFDYIKPATEHAVTSFYQLLMSTTNPIPLAAPTSLMKIKNVATRRIRSPSEDSLQNKEAYSRFNQLALEYKGDRLRALAEHPEVKNALHFKLEFSERVAQVGFGLGDMCFRDMLSVVATVKAFWQATAENYETLYLHIINNTLLTSYLADRPLLQSSLAHACEDAELLWSLWLAKLTVILPERRPLEFIDLGNMDKLKILWHETINQFGINAMAQLLILLEACPDLLRDKSINDGASIIRYLKFAAWLWPKMTPEEVLTQAHQWLAQGNSDQFGRLIIASLITQPADGKADNYRVKLIRNELGQAIEWLIQAIDNDNNFASAIHHVQEQHHIATFCILYFIKDMMQKTVDKELIDTLLQKHPAVWLFNWLAVLAQQFNVYIGMQQKAIILREDLKNSENMDMLDIPFCFAPGKITELFKKFSDLQAFIKERQADNRKITYQQLFQHIEPLLALTYEVTQEKNPQPLDAFHAIHHKSHVSLELLLKDYLAAPYPHDPNKNFQQVMIESARNENHDATRTQSIIDAVKELWDQIDLNNTDPLSAFAILVEISKFTDLKLEQNKNIDQKTKLIWLKLAIAQKHPLIVKLIINSGMNLKEVDADLKNALHYYGNYYYHDQYSDTAAAEMASILLSAKNIDLYAEDDSGKTPLYYVIRATKPSSKPFHVRAETSIVDCSQRCEQFLKLWTEQGFTLDISQKKTGLTLLDICVEQDNWTGFCLLVKYGASALQDINKAVAFIEKNNDKPESNATTIALRRQNPGFAYLKSLDKIANTKKPGSAKRYLKIQGAISGTRYLPPEIAKLAFTNDLHLRKEEPEDSNNNNENRPKIKIHKEGRHAVVSANWQGETLIFKEQPELPTIEAAVNIFAEQLIGHGTAHSELFAAVDSKGASYPLLISQYVEGVNLDDVLYPKKRNIITEEQALHYLANLDHESLSDLILLLLLTNPEDGHPKNFIVAPFINHLGKLAYRIIGIDNDHAFTPATTMKKAGDFASINLLLKCSIFCLDAMKKPLHPDSVKRFLRHDPHTMLRTWLLELERRQASYEQLKFTKSKLPSFLRKNKLADSIIPLPFQNKTMSIIYDKFESLQEQLKENASTIPLELMRIIMPTAAAFYEASFTNLVAPQKPGARFCFIAEGHYTKTNGRDSTLTTGPEIIKILESDENNNNVKCYGPSEALLILELIANESNQIKETIEFCESGKVDSRSNPLASLIRISSKEKILANINWKNIPYQAAKDLLKAFAGTPFTKLTIKNCHQIRDKDLIPLLSGAPELRKLELENLPLSSSIFEAIEKYNPQIEKISLTHMKNMSSLRANRPIELPHLRSFALKRCHAFASISFASNNFEALHIEGCSFIPELNLPADNLRYLSILSYISYRDQFVRFLEKVNKLDYLDMKVKTKTELKKSLNNNFDHNYRAVEQLKRIIAKNNLWTKANIAYFILDNMLDYRFLIGKSSEVLAKIATPVANIEYIDAGDKELTLLETRKILQVFPNVKQIVKSSPYIDIFTDIPGNAARAITCDIENEIISATALNENTILLGFHSGRVNAYEIATGRLIYSEQINATDESALQPFQKAGAIVDKRITALSIHKDGTFVAAYKTVKFFPTKKHDNNNLRGGLISRVTVDSVNNNLEAIRVLTYDYIDHITTLLITRNKQLVTGHKSGYVKIQELLSRGLKDFYVANKGVTALALANDLAIIFAYDNGKVYHIDSYSQSMMRQHDPVLVADLSQPVKSIVPTHNDHTLIFICANNANNLSTVIHYDAATLSAIKYLKTDTSFTAIKYLDNNKLVALTDDGVLKLFRPIKHAINLDLREKVANQVMVKASTHMLIVQLPSELNIKLYELIVNDKINLLNNVLFGSQNIPCTITIKLNDKIFRYNSFPVFQEENNQYALHDGQVVNHQIEIIILPALRKVVIYSYNPELIVNLRKLSAAYFASTLELPVPELENDLTHALITEEDRDFWLNTSPQFVSEMPLSPPLIPLRSNEEFSLAQEFVEAPQYQFDPDNNNSLANRDKHLSLIPEIERMEIVKLEALLAEGLDINLYDTEGYTLALRACQKGHIYVLRWLLEHEADLTLLTSDKKDAIKVAEEHGQKVILEYLRTFIRPLPADIILTNQSSALVRMWVPKINKYKRTTMTRALALDAISNVTGIETNVGHLSMEVKNPNLADQYVSHWPGMTDVTFFTSKGHNNNINDDKRREHGMPNAHIVLYSLRTKAMHAYYTTNYGHTEWSLLGILGESDDNYNCSGLVYKLLEIGGIFEHLLSDKDRLSKPYTPEKVLKLAEKAMERERILYPETKQFFIDDKDAYKKEMLALSKMGYDDREKRDELIKSKEDLFFLYAKHFPQEMHDLNKEIHYNVKQTLNKDLINHACFNETLIPEVIATVEKLLKQGANLDYHDNEGYNALHLAIMVGNYQIAKMLLETFPDSKNSKVKRKPSIPVHDDDAVYDKIYFFKQPRAITVLDLAIEKGDPQLIDLLTKPSVKQRL